MLGPDASFVAVALVPALLLSAACNGGDSPVDPALVGGAPLSAGAPSSGTSGMPTGGSGSTGGALSSGGAASGGTAAGGAPAIAGAHTGATTSGGFPALGGASGQGGTSADSWLPYAQGFTQTYCVSCHNDDQMGDASRDYHLLANVQMESKKIACGVASSQQIWTARGCSGFPPAHQFPVGNGPKPSDQERERFVAWIDAGAK